MTKCLVTHTCEPSGRHRNYRITFLTALSGDFPTHPTRIDRVPSKSEQQSAVSAATMNLQLPADLFAGFLAMSSDAVVVIDEAQRIIFFNRGAERIFEWKASEVGGLPLETLLPVRFRGMHGGHLREFGASHGAPRTMGERQQISGLRKSGEEFPAEASIQQMRVGGRQIFAAMLRDITPRVKAETALRQAVTARDDMIGIVSHDLRNPANAVKMLARSIIEMPEGVPESVVERVQVIHQAAAQIDALIQDLLDVTRIEAGRLTVNPQRIALLPLISQALTQLSPLAASSRVTVEITPSSEALDVMADPDRLTQVLSNLVGNAFKFTPSGGRVEIDVRRDEGVADIRIADTGVGIPAEQVERVFDRFYQASGKARRHGAGLGLPIARGIIEAHGGTIGIQSEVDIGTTVHFTLPLAT